MARSHARFELALFSPDRDPDLAALSKDAKLLYIVIVTDPALNYAGVVVLRTGVWAEEASLNDDEFDQAFDELEKTQFTVVDRRTSELLVRSFIRSDKVAEQPNVLKGALAQAQQVRSRIVRRALASELRRLPPKQPDKIGKRGQPVVYPDPHLTAALLDPDGGPGTGARNPSGNPSPNPSGNPSSEGSAGTLPGRDAGTPGGRGRGRGEGSSSVDGLFGVDDAPASPKVAVPAIVGAWVDAVTATGPTKPQGSMKAQVGKEARQLLADGVDPELLLRAAESCGSKGFPTLHREVLQMQRNVRPLRFPGTPPPGYNADGSPKRDKNGVWMER